MPPWVFSGLFGAFLGYNPIGVLLPPLVQQQLAPADLNILLSTTFFPTLIAEPFMVGLRTVFYVGAAMCVLGAVASALRTESRTKPYLLTSSLPACLAKAVCG